MTVGGRKVLLKNIKAPVLNLVATKDHLVPPASSLALNSKIGSADVATIEFPVGHVGLSVSSSAIAKLWPRVIEWLKSRSGSPRTRKKISK
ncbi:MAG: hypothetical protein HYT79_11825 [Elusimicrobia bacterium]|nr:hypothetical protein [Elusimicrobiota bacterium]